MTDPSLRWRQPAVVPATGVSLPPGMPSIRCLFQPIVDLSTERVVGFEALTRGVDDRSVAGNSDALFEWARRTGRLHELDWACRMTAMHTALELQMRAGCGLFVNVEPAALGGEAPYGFDQLVEAMHDSGIAVVFEFTERALADNSASLLRLGDWVREQGWAVAIDDIGADPGSLALVPLLRPEIIKLDLRLIQARTTVDVAQIVNAVNAEAGRTGALVLAEGIETERHAALAVSMGAHLGQGWLFGRPSAEPSMDTAPLPSSMADWRSPDELPDVPWELASASPKVRRADKVLLEAMSRHLERQAMASTDPVVVVGTFQNAEQYNASTARRFAALAASGAVVAVLGRGIGPEPSVGVQGQSLSSHDELITEWTIAVVTAHFAGALIAKDCGDAGEDATRRFDYLVTYDRDTVIAAAEIMLRRFESHPVTADRDERPVSIVRNQVAEAARHDRQLPLLARAIASSSNGITIVDATAPDLPLVYVNTGFEQMTGYLAGEMLGRNCRFLQGPQTDRHAVDDLREMIRSGTGGQVTLLNYHRDGTPWWNEVHISPVVDSGGKLTHFIGIQHDVSARVAAAAGSAVPQPAPKAAIAEFVTATPKIGAEYGEPMLHRSSHPLHSADVVLNAADVESTRDLPVVSPDVIAVNGYHAPSRDPDRPTLPDRVAAQAYLHSLLSAEPGIRSGAVTLLLCSLAPEDPDDPHQQLNDLDIDTKLRVRADLTARAIGSTIGTSSVGAVFSDGHTEFGVICRLFDEHVVVAAFAMAGRMHQAVIRALDTDETGLSIGIALSPDNGRTVEELWRNAEAALVLAEDSGPSGTRYAADVLNPSLIPVRRSGRLATPWPSR
jgi:PAS domain S-box-containing protein